MDGGTLDLSRLRLVDIKRLLDEEKADDGLIQALAHDPRSGARDLYHAHARRVERELREVRRVDKLFREESALARRGFNAVAGVDEAGRGPLAGPVVAAAVILPLPTIIMGLNDSKRLTPMARERVAGEVRQKAVAWGIGLASVEEINAVNILQASLLAMRRALTVMGAAPECVLVDGNQSIPGLALPQQTLVGGDARSASVAAASVLAKDFRDRLMCGADDQYPGYGYAFHKGYPTRAHYKALFRWGPCPLHRKAFLPGRYSFTDWSAEQQKG